MSTQLGQASSPTAYAIHNSNGGDLDPSSPGPFVPHHGQRYNDPFRGYTPEDNGSHDADENREVGGGGSALEQIAEEGDVVDDVLDATGGLSSTQNELPLGDTLGEASPPPHRLDRTAVSVPPITAETPEDEEVSDAAGDSDEEKGDENLPHSDSEKRDDHDDGVKQNDGPVPMDHDSAHPDDVEVPPTNPNPVTPDQCIEYDDDEDDMFTPREVLLHNNKVDKEEDTSFYCEAKPPSTREDHIDDDHNDDDEGYAQKEGEVISPNNNPPSDDEDDRHTSPKEEASSDSKSSTSSSDEENEEELLREAELVAQSFA
eukprot:TRINITY_DN10194_c0_g1_i6.p1 TRINITY_DN10194_c0_g1~~TRINITY_DN10194_c0_g1_i6.p1  ORF type:complete len:316 (+),score=85.05 TRINITY_DN10194_c0_g1_i6:84-1031(+)